MPQKLWLTLAVFSTTSVAMVADDSTPSQSEVARRLRHSEGLLTSVSAQFRLEVSPSTNLDIQRIGQVLKSRGIDADPRKHCTNDTVAKRSNHTMIWKFKNGKELIDKTLTSIATGDPIKRVQAFDGAIVRTVNIDSQGAQAVLKKPNPHGNWYSRVEYTPLYLVTSRFETPWSKVINESKKVDIANSQIGDIPVLRISIPVDETAIIKRDELFYDSDFRLVRRDRYGFHPINETEVRLMERHDFRDYRRHTHVSGEDIYFPYETSIHHVFGICPDGEPAVWNRALIRIENFEVMPEIPDSDFVPQLPPNATVKDELVTNELIPIERQQVAWRPQNSAITVGARLLRIAPIVVACALTTFAVIWVRRRSRGSK